MALIGYRGCGKTSVGRIVARRLGRPFVDTDERIESRAGRTIREIFATDGEPYFRTLEREALVAALAAPLQVISLGGGAVLSADNRADLESAATCVWLTAEIDTLVARVRADPRSAERRPALTGDDLVDEVRRLLDERVPYYAALAAARIDTTGLTIEQAAHAVCRAVAARSGAFPSR